MHAVESFDEVVGRQLTQTGGSARTTPDRHLVRTSETAQLGLELAGIRLDLTSREQVLGLVRSRLAGRATGTPPLAIGSVNLDHIHHFGARGRSRRSAGGPARRFDGGLDWRMLVDGAPVARRASVVTGRSWPRLTGADLLPDVLDVAAATGARVGFLGGHDDTVPALRAALATRWPALCLTGVWTPPRDVIEDPVRSRELARAINDAGVDVLVVGLGKPRQELWTDAHGAATGAQVLTVFGAAADFLAGSARRAPTWVRRAGFEWAFRLVLEPQRLWRRYLVQGPRALHALRAAPPSVAYLHTSDQIDLTIAASDEAMASLVKR